MSKKPIGEMSEDEIRALMIENEKLGYATRFIDPETGKEAWSLTEEGRELVEKLLQKITN